MGNAGLSTGKILTTDMVNLENGTKWIKDGSNLRLFYYDGSAWQDSGVAFEI